MKVIYLLTHAPHAARLVVSISTLRRYFDGIVEVYTTTPESHWIGDRLAESPLRVSHCTFNQAVTRRNSTYLTKVELFNSNLGTDTTLFLDADTTIHGSLSEVESLLATRPILVPQFSSWSAGGPKVSARTRRWETIKTPYGDEVFAKMLKAAMHQSVPAINVGVLGLSVGASSMMNEWRELAYCGAHTFIPDEISFQILLPKMLDLSLVHVVSDRYNHSPLYGTNCVPVIRHYHGDKHLHSRSVGVWLDEFHKCVEANTADIQSWMPYHDEPLRQFLLHGKA